MNSAGDSNQLASNILNFIEIYKELSKVNQDINNEAGKLRDCLNEKSLNNNTDLNNVDEIIKKKESELGKLKNLKQILSTSKLIYDEIIGLLPVGSASTHSTARNHVAKVEKQIQCNILNEFVDESKKASAVISHKVNEKPVHLKPAEIPFNVAKQEAHDPRHAIHQCHDLKKVGSFQVIDYDHRESGMEIDARPPTNPIPPEPANILFDLINSINKNSKPVCQQSKPVTSQAVSASSSTSMLLLSTREAPKPTKTCLKIEKNDKLANVMSKRNSSILSTKFHNDMKKKLRKAYGKESEQRQPLLLSSMQSLMNYDLCKVKSGNHRKDSTFSVSTAIKKNEEIDLYFDSFENKQPNDTNPQMNNEDFDDLYGDLDLNIEPADQDVVFNLNEDEFSSSSDANGVLVINEDIVEEMHTIIETTIPEKEVKQSQNRDRDQRTSSSSSSQKKHYSTDNPSKSSSSSSTTHHKYSKYKENNYRSSTQSKERTRSRSPSSSYRRPHSPKYSDHKKRKRSPVLSERGDKKYSRY